MKVLLALAVLATSATALASSSDIYDIQYLPNAGTTYGFSTLDYLQGKIEPKGGSDSKIKGPRFEQTIGHSFSDRLSVQASLNYLKFTNSTSGSSDTDTKGISDPTVTARFRMIDEAIRLDLVGGALIGVGDNKTKSNGDSNNLNGGSNLFIGAQVGEKRENLQWSFLAQVTRHMEATFKDSSNSPSTTVKDDAHNDLLLRADLLNKLAEMSYLRSHLSTQFTDSYKDDSTPKTETASQTIYEIGTEYQHLLSKDLMLRAGVDYQLINQYAGQIDKISAWDFKIGANYQF